MRIAVGSDERHAPLRANLVELLDRLGQEVVEISGEADQEDTGPDCPPTDVAEQVAQLVGNQEVERGILVCGSDLGGCIVANKIPGVRAAPCHDDLTAELSRRHNDLNVLCLCGDMHAEKLIDRLVEIWLTTPFEAGRHARRLRKVTAFEQRREQPADQATSPAS